MICSDQVDSRSSDEIDSGSSSNMNSVRSRICSSNENSIWSSIRSRIYSSDKNNSRSSIWRSTWSASKAIIPKTASRAAPKATGSTAIGTKSTEPASGSALLSTLGFVTLFACNSTLLLRFPSITVCVRCLFTFPL